MRNRLDRLEWFIMGIGAGMGLAVLGFVSVGAIW